MRLPGISQTNVLLGLLAVLLIGSVLNNRESLLFCEKALYGEMETLRKEGTVKEALKFTDVCPEVRQRQENNLNKWLEVILALLVQFHPPASPSP
jgi:hypothetical protein